MESKRNIQLSGILSSFSTKVDGGASLRFSTQELSDTDILELKRSQGQFGWVLFSPNRFSVEDIPREIAEDKNKTPAKRLRNTLFVLFEQNGSKGDFEVFYREKMEKIINLIKDKLD